MMTDADAPGREGGPKAKIFISYSRKDLAFADRLDAALKARGFETFIDREDIHALEKWWERATSPNSGLMRRVRRADAAG
jgi:TIR domain